MKNEEVNDNKWILVGLLILIGIALMVFPGSYFLAAALSLIPEWIAPYVFWTMILFTAICVSVLTKGE